MKKRGWRDEPLMNPGLMRRSTWFLYSSAQVGGVYHRGTFKCWIAVLPKSLCPWRACQQFCTLESQLRPWPAWRRDRQEAVGGRKQASGIFLAPAPFRNRIAHGFWLSIFKPCHERAVKFEMIAAVGHEEAPYILGVAVRRRDWRFQGDLAAVPIKTCHGHRLPQSCQESSARNPRSNGDFK